MKRREFISLVGGAAAWPVTARAQHANGARIGFLGAASATGFQVQALRAGLRDFGYIEGNNIAIEYRFAEGKYERLPELAIELVALKVSLIVTHSTAGTKDKERAMSQTPNTAIAVIGIDIGKNSFHVVGHDARGAIVLRQSGRVAKWKRGSPTYRLA